MKIEYKTQDVLAVAFRAFKINNGYVKDTVRFSEPTNNTVSCNKDPGPKFPNASQSLDLILLQCKLIQMIIQMLILALKHFPDIHLVC